MSIPVMECNIGFSFFKRFDKAVNTFVNARDMHAFPTIQNKIQVKDDNNDPFTGNKFDSVLEAVKRRHTRRHNWSTSNQKISKTFFLTKMIRRMRIKSSMP